MSTFGKSSLSRTEPLTSSGWKKPSERIFLLCVPKESLRGLTGGTTGLFLTVSGEQSSRGKCGKQVREESGKARDVRVSGDASRIWRRIISHKHEYKTNQLLQEMFHTLVLLRPRLNYQPSPCMDEASPTAKVREVVIGYRFSETSKKSNVHCLW